MSIEKESEILCPDCMGEIDPFLEIRQHLTPETVEKMGPGESWDLWKCTRCGHVHNISYIRGYWIGYRDGSFRKHQSGIVDKAVEEARKFTKTPGKERVILNHLSANLKVED